MTNNRVKSDCHLFLVQSGFLSVYGHKGNRNRNISHYDIYDKVHDNVYDNVYDKVYVNIYDK